MKGRDDDNNRDEDEDGNLAQSSVRDPETFCGSGQSHKAEEVVGERRVKAQIL